MQVSINLENPKTVIIKDGVEYLVRVEKTAREVTEEPCSEEAPHNQTITTLQPSKVCFEHLARAPLEVQVAFRRFELLDASTRESILAQAQLLLELSTKAFMDGAAHKCLLVDEELKKLFAQLDSKTGKFLNAFYAAREGLPLCEDPVVHFVKDMVVVPTDNPNSHEYLLHMPCQIKDPSDKRAIMFGRPSTGNHLTAERYALRLPNLEEIVAMLAARK